MPPRYLMSWNKSQRRWEKMHRKVRYWVTCADLGLPSHHWNKEDSGPLSNAWWERKLAALNAEQLKLHPHATRLGELEVRLAYCTRQGLHEEAARLKGEIETLTGSVHTHPELRLANLVAESLKTAGSPHAELEQHLEEAATRPSGATREDTSLERNQRKKLEELLDVDLGHVPQFILTKLAEREALQSIAPTEAVWADRLKREKLTPPERTIGATAGVWIRDRREEAGQEVRSHEGADALERGLKHFTEFVGAGTAVDTINFDVWHRWFTHCSSRVAMNDRDDKTGWTADTAQKYFTISKTFVRWLHQSDRLLALPKNIANKGYKFERPPKAIPVFSDSEVTALLAAARGIHRLILLLMLNCGMTQKDVADLRRTEVDVEAGRITRRRSKTRRKKSSVVVSYKLWPETRDLLNRHLEEVGELALRTKSGKPWVWSKTTTDQKLKSSDNVATIFNTIKQRIGMTGKGKSLKVFRKTSATRLKGNRDHKDVRFLFLGHSEKNLADIHYADVTQEMLDAATEWLRTQYTFGEGRTATTATTPRNGN